MTGRIWEINCTANFRLKEITAWLGLIGSTKKDNKDGALYVLLEKSPYTIDRRIIRFYIGKQERFMQSILAHYIVILFNASSFSDVMYLVSSLV